MPKAEPEHASDVELVTRVAGGDRDAFAALYDRHGSILLGLILRIVRVRAEAEDVLQETFLQVWQRAGDFDEARGRAFPWLAMLARSRALDRLRSRGFRDRMADALAAEPSEPAAGDVADEAARVEAAEVVKRALARIPDSQRTALLLAYFDGLTQSEIAARLGKPLGTVKTHTRLGLLRLRQLLAEEAPG